jgi:hypothetical protein
MNHTDVARTTPTSDSTTMVTIIVAVALVLVAGLAIFAIIRRGKRK